MSSHGYFKIFKKINITSDPSLVNANTAALETNTASITILDEIIEVTSDGNKWSGPWLTDEPEEYIITKIGNMIIFDSGNTLQRTADVTPAATIKSTVPIPVEYRPSSVCIMPVNIVSNSISNTGKVVVNTDGTIEVFDQISGAGKFSPSAGTKVDKWSMAWTT